MSWKLLAGVGIVVVALIAGLFYFTSPSNGPGPHDEFAKCLSEKGVKFYGAFWCAHCNREKALFGNSVHYLNYIECSQPDGQRQTQACISANINSYPTWEFADGSRQTGELSLEQLSQKTGCSLIEPKK